ncbi:MAG TPA: 1-deoxy-D-xylulose-5-phosphate reductoisomerase [Hyphomicrobiaceae bacterium]|nr:1-deoxy-D-xylulose-5-phosphate reductoisomerase [Hyphomicrobiaceae bacterium]
MPLAPLASAHPAGGTAAPRRITVLGATGSIGMNTLDLIARNPDRFEVVALTAQSQVAKLAELARAHRARLAVIGDERLYSELKRLLAGSGVRAAAGQAELIEAAAYEADCVVAAMVGAAGLAPTLAAARQGRRLALANKECLVTAGTVFMAAVRSAGTELIPIDSEHSAAFQALAGSDPSTIEKMTLTASGGPFRTWDRARLARATPEEALRHPNWTMGPKVTVDSATLMNKGLELIEAYHLFPVGADQLDVVVHPQSIVHCLVSYRDGSVLAQLSCPDMRTPIALSLAWPSRMPTPTRRLDLVTLGSLTFEAPDEERFPSLGLARAALARGGSAPAVLNAANEVAVAAFLGRSIGFLDIPRAVATCLELAEGRGLIIEPRSLDDVLAAEAEARQLAHSVIGDRVGAA